MAAPHLPELERLAMEQVWERGEATVRDVLDGVNAGRPGAPRAYTTVLTIMKRLEVKGMVERRRREKSDVYRAVLTREQYLGRRIDAEVSRLVEDFGELALVQFARRVEGLDADRREALRRLSES